MALHYRTCPFCEATCGLEVETEGTEVVSVRGRRATTCSATASSARRVGLKQLHEDPDRLRTPLVRARRRAASRRPGTRRSRRSTGACRRSSTSTAATRSPSTSATRTRTTSPRSLYGPRLAASARHRRTSSRRSTVDQMPKQVCCRADVRHGLTVPVPDVDRTDHLLMLGANPLVSNGSLLTAPDMRGRLRRSASAAARSWSSTRAARAPPRRPTSTTSSGPAPTRSCSPRWCYTLLEEDLVDPGRLAEHVTGLDEVTRAGCATFTPEGVADACGIEADEIRRMARELAAAPSAPPSTAASAPARRSSARSRAGWSTCSTCSPATSTARAARCSRSRRPASATPSGTGRQRQGRALRALAQPRARAARDLRRAAGGVPGRGDRHAGRGPGARAGHGRRQPGPVDAQLRPARARARGPRLHGRGRHLRQRDDPPRRRHPARARAAREVALRPRALPARGAQRRQLLAAGARAARARPSGRSFLRLAGVLAGQGPNADGDGARRPGDRRRSSSARWATRARASPAATRPS